ncbi:hypothetical protein RIF29_00269 [Crotalaria pallida]|uniref:Uncharacterized protein n=1 Tax=Crotalaria pallida TaxID=3830 RepID=A0AAN9IXB9_CROPI
MKAKEFVGLRAKTPGEDDPSVVICRYTCLMNLCRSLCTSSSVSVAKFNESRDKFMVDIKGARSMDGDSNIDDDTRNGERVEDPSSSCSRKKGRKRCSLCHVQGHNKRSCPGLCNSGAENEDLYEGSAQEMDAEVSDDGEGAEGMWVSDDDSEDDRQESDEAESMGDTEDEDHFDAFEVEGEELAEDIDDGDK